MCVTSLGGVGRLKQIAIWGVSVLVVLTPAAVRADPAPPPSALNGLVRRLAERRAGALPPPALSKAELFKPEFHFRPASQWLLLPDLAKQLSTNEAERAAVFELLDKGTRETNRLFAGEGADNDVAAATVFFLTQLWSMVRGQEIPDSSVDALHAQLVGVMGGPEMARLSDADKQRYWEFCVGFPIFVLGMKEVATDPAAVADLRSVAAGEFATLIGVRPELVDLGPKGLVIGAAAEAELAKERASKAPTKASGQPDASSAAGVSGITYIAPAGWQRGDAGWATIFRATLRDVQDNGQARMDTEGRHAGSIFVLPVRSVGPDVRATFEQVWREQFGEVFSLGDTVVHYRARVKSGLVIHYMGRFFHRKTDPENAFNNYGVLYFVDLGGGRVQPIVGIVVPNDPGLGMASFKETAALRALSWPLAGLLNSVQPARGTAPYPAGGYFAPAEIQGQWLESSSAFGGFYVNDSTGASAGAAIHSSAGHLDLNADGTYDYAFGFSTYNPQFGTTSGAEKHSGRYRLNGDIVLGEASTPVRTPLRRCAVGVGTRQTKDGVKRVLVMVLPDNDGVYRAPPLVPNWDSYDGIIKWFEEK